MEIAYPFGMKNGMPQVLTYLVMPHIAHRKLRLKDLPDENLEEFEAESADDVPWLEYSEIQMNHQCR